MNLALAVSYNGASFHGWHFQNESTPTVQAHLESALSSIANEPIRVTCAGRTDAGVHATNQVVNFTTQATRQIKAWVSGTNTMLPDSISVTHATAVAEDFHARFSAVSRRYLYIIYGGDIRSALMPELMTREHRSLDVGRMHDAAQSLLGENDFTSYRAANCQSRTATRNVTAINVDRVGDLVLIDVSANAFLHHMVRNVVGVLLDVGAGNKPVAWPGELLALGDRSRGSKTAPANGLYLVGVGYGADMGIPSLTWPPFLHDRA